MAGRKSLIVAAATLTALLACGVQAKAMPVMPLQALASHDGADMPAVETVGWHFGWGWHHRHHWRHYRHYGYYRHYHPWHHRWHRQHYRHWYGRDYGPRAHVYRF